MVDFSSFSLVQQLNRREKNPLLCSGTAAMAVPRQYARIRALNPILFRRLLTLIVRLTLQGSLQLMGPKRNQIVDVCIYLVFMLLLFPGR